MYNSSPTKIIQSNSVLELYKPKIIQFESLDILYKKAIEWITDKTLEISGEYGTTRLALSTGNTLNELYKLIGKSCSFPFEEIELYQTDENYKTCSSQAALLKLITPSNLQLCKTRSVIKNNSTIDEETTNYSDILDQFDEDEGFDICVLEIRKDGSIAGLSARSNGLTGNSQIVINNGDIISVSIDTILKSREIVCILNDDNDVLEEIMEGQKPALDFPVKILLAHPNVTVFFYLDI